MRHLVIFQLCHQAGISMALLQGLNATWHTIITPVMITNPITDIGGTLGLHNIREIQTEQLLFIREINCLDNQLRRCSFVSKLLGFLLSWQILFVKPRLILVVAKFIAVLILFVTLGEADLS